MLGTKNHPLVGKTVETEDGVELGVVAEVLPTQGLVWIQSKDLTFPISAVQIVGETNE